MKNTFDLRKFLTENKNTTEEEIEDAIEDLKYLLQDLEMKSEEARSIVKAIDPGQVEVLDRVQAFDFGFSSNPYDRTLRKFYQELTGEDGEIYEGEEDLDEEVVNESLTAIIGAVKFMLGALAGLAGLAGVTEYIINAKEGKYGEKQQKGAEKLYKIMDYIGRGKKK